MNKIKSQSSSIALILSLAFHSFLFLWLAQWAQQQNVSDQDTPLEIVFEEPNEQIQLVQAPQQSKKLETPPKKEVQFKSHSTNRVDLESVAPVKPALIKANMASGGQEGTQKKQAKKQESTSDEPGEFVADKREELILPGFGSTSAPPMIPQHVQQSLPKGVRLGNITALNTDQHRFYNFNQRLLTQFVPLWGDRVRKALKIWLSNNNPPIISKTWVTNVEIIMNEKGEILDVKPFRLSGFWEIDSASIDAFKLVEKVPNPPNEMIDENGYVHMQFQTEVIWIPAPPKVRAERRNRPFPGF